MDNSAGSRRWCGEGRSRREGEERGFGGVVRGSRPRSRTQLHHGAGRSLSKPVVAELVLLVRVWVLPLIVESGADPNPRAVPNLIILSVLLLQTAGVIETRRRNAVSCQCDN